MRTIIFVSAALMLSACGSNLPEQPDAADHVHEDGQGHTHSHGSSTRGLDDTLMVTELELDAAQMASLHVTTVTPRYQRMEGSVRLTGRVMTSPVSKAEITAPIAAKVASVLVDEGAHVRKGQALLTLTDIGLYQLQQDYLSARTRHAQAVRELQRQRQLLEGDATARRHLEEAEAAERDLAARRSALAGQLRLLGIDGDSLDPDRLEDHFVVRSPMEGRVNGIRIYLGSRVEPTTVLMEVIDLEHFHVHLNAYERDLALLQEGVLFPFTVMNLPGRSFTGELFSIGRTFDADGRTIPVHAHVEEGSHDLVEGMSVLADVPTGGARLLAVPDGALARSGDVGYVYVDEGPTEEGGHRFRQVEVRPGLSRAGWTAVTPSEPLDSATAIAGDGVFYLRSTLTNSGEE